MIPSIAVQSDSAVPIYRQLYEQVRDQILDGRIRDGDRLPPTREWAGSLGVNRATVAAAYELLEKDGLIHGHVGRGSFVKAPAKPANISFASSRPSSDLFPLDEFRAAAAEVIAEPALSSILQLGSPLGYEPLRKLLLGDARGRGLIRRDEDVLVTNGCQHALDLIQRALLLPGDLVFVEDPVYPGLRELFHRAGARLTGVPVTNDGLSLAEFERELRRERPKLLVVTPNFQNPTGATMPLAARQEVLRLAAAYGVSVVENDIYSSLRYHGRAVTSLKELDAAGQVIQLGSFSKVSFPGLRVGWILGPRDVIARCAESRQWCDLHGDQLSQAILTRFAESGALERHRRRVLEAGSARLAAAVQGCEEFLPAQSEFTKPQGGMSLWVRLPGAADSGELLRRCAESGVDFLPGRYFSVTHPHPSALRLCFAGLAPARIREGIRILGRLAADEVSRSRESVRLQPAVAMV